MNIKTFLYRFQFYGFGVLLGIIVVILFFGDRQLSCSYFPNQRVLKKIIDQKPPLPPTICNRDTLGFLNTLYHHGQVDFSESNIHDTDTKQYLVHLRSADTLNMSLSFQFTNDSTVQLLDVSCHTSKD